MFVAHVPVVRSEYISRLVGAGDGADVVGVSDGAGVVVGPGVIVGPVVGASLFLQYSAFDALASAFLLPGTQVAYLPPDRLSTHPAGMGLL